MKLPGNNLIKNNTIDIIGVNWDKLYTAVPRRETLSSLSVKNLIQISDTASASGTFGNGQSLTITTNLTPNNLFSDARMLATPYVAVYEGTAAVGSMQIYPRYGAGITVGDYTTQSGYDYDDFDEFTEDFKVGITNVAAGNVSVYAVTRWRYISERGGTAT